MEINVINNKIFTKNSFKNKNKRKRNLIIYHFLVESKPHERIDLLTVNIYQTKKSISIVIKTCVRKTDEAIWESPLSTNHLFPSNFFITPLCPNFKNEKHRRPPPSPLILGGGGENYE